MRTSRNLEVRHAGVGLTAPLRALVALVTVGAMALTVTACSGNNGSPRWNGGATGSPEQGRPSVTIAEPADGAKDVPASTGITFATANTTGATVEVEMKDESGSVVEGRPSPDGKGWLPDRQLDYGTSYTATVRATGPAGAVATAISNFTTMRRPSRQVRVTSFIGDGQVVGVAMPLIVKFSRAIPQDYRDDVQLRMTVRSTPAQEGAWRWISPTEVHYRPKEFWQANTAISYKVRTGGLPMGGGWFGRADLTVDARVGPSFIMTVDNRTKQMTVTKDGTVIKTIPVSLGKKSTPSSSGTMVVMEKLKKTVFDTLEELGPEDGYRTEIDYAQRLTYGGEFIHAAPWSEGKQGRVNVSHGCVNVSMAMGAWLFERTRVGDPITVKGTERTLKLGNGWTDWNLSWDEYVKGSAIPYEPPSEDPDLGATGSPSPEPTA